MDDEKRSANRERKRRERKNMEDLVYVQIKIHPTRRAQLRELEPRLRKPAKVKNG